MAQSFPALVWKAFKDNAQEKISFQGLRFILSELEDVSKRDFNERKTLFPQRPLVEVLSSCNTGKVSFINL